MYLLEEVKDPIVSVIIPVYNGKDKIGRAIDSVLNQTFEDFELIIVDDASTDGTIDTVLNYKDERILIVRHSKNREKSASRNDGAKLARGKYLAFLDHDDEWLPEKLEKQVKFFDKANEEFGVVYTGYYQIMEEKKNNKEVIESPFLCCVKVLEGDLYEELKRSDFILPSSVMIKRDIFEAVGGFDERLASPEAWDLWLRLSKITKFKFINKPLVNRYVHGKNSIFRIVDPFEVEDENLEYITKKHRDVDIPLNTWVKDNFKNLNEFISFVKSEKFRVVIFGASLKGRAVLRWLKDKNIKCDFFVDNDSSKWGKKVEGIPIKNPNALKTTDIVFVASGWSKEIVKQLSNIGIHKIMIATE